MAEMADENDYVNVDGNSSEDSALQMSSDESEIDVGADDGYDLNEDGAGEDGDESPNRRDHHNDLEKRRRKNITRSYLRLKKLVRRVGGDRKGLSSCGRDKTLLIANNLLKEKLRQLAKSKSIARKLSAKLQASLPTLEGKDRETIQKHIEELNEVGQNTMQLQPLPPDLRASEYIKEEGEESEEEVERSNVIALACVDDEGEEQGAEVDDLDLDEEADNEEGWATSNEYASDEDSDDTAPSPFDDTAPSPSGDNVL